MYLANLFFDLTSKNIKKNLQRTVRISIICFRHRQVLYNQVIGPLLAGPVQIWVHPFERVGVDYAGPLWMHFNQRGRRPAKVFLCVFVCFVTKACHLELESDFFTITFIAALKRFLHAVGLLESCSPTTPRIHRGRSRQWPNVCGTTRVYTIYWMTAVSSLLNFTSYRHDRPISGAYEKVRCKWLNSRSSYYLSTPVRAVVWPKQFWVIDTG